MRVEQRGGSRSGSSADRRVGAGVALGEPHTSHSAMPRRPDKSQPRRIVGAGAVAEQREDDRPEQVARVGVILAAAQRFFARQGAEHQDPRARVDDRRKAALGGRVGRSQSTKRPRRTAVWPLHEPARRHDQDAIVIGRAHFAPVVAADQRALLRQDLEPAKIADEIEAVAGDRHRLGDLDHALARVRVEIGAAERRRHRRG